MIGCQNASAQCRCGITGFLKYVFSCSSHFNKICSNQPYLTAGVLKTQCSLSSGAFDVIKEQLCPYERECFFRSSVPPILTNFECATFKNFLMSDARWPLTLVHIAKMLASLVFLRSKKEKPAVPEQLASARASWRLLCDLTGLLCFLLALNSRALSAYWCQERHSSLRSRQRRRRVSR